MDDTDNMYVPRAHLDVTLVAHTAHTGLFPHLRPQGDESDLDFLAEIAGRSCYESYTRPNPATRANADYLAHIISSEHNSVLEHASATFYVTGVSRSLLAELTRHRHLSFSVLSQRYVDSSDAQIVIPPAMTDQRQIDVLSKAAAEAIHDYAEHAEVLACAGLKRKQAREAARAILPNCLETKIVVTGSMAAWRYVLKRRMDPSSDAEIHQLANEIYRQLVEIAPGSMQGLAHEYETDENHG